MMHEKHYLLAIGSHLFMCNAYTLICDRSIVSFKTAGIFHMSTSNFCPSHSKTSSWLSNPQYYYALLQNKTWQASV